MHRFPNLVPYWRLSAYYFAYFAFFGVFGPYFGLYFQSLSLSAWDIGVLMSLMQSMRVFGPVLSGSLADRLTGRVQIIRLSSLLALLAFLAYFHFGGIVALLVVTAVLSFFWTAILPVLEALTFDHLQEESARYSRIRLWGSVGFIVAVTGTGILLDHSPLLGVLWAGSAVLGVMLICAWAVPEAHTHRSSAGDEPIGPVFLQKRVKALFVACFAMSMAHGAYYVFYSIFLADHGYSKSLVGGLWSLGVLAEIAVLFFMSRLMRRFSLRMILLASFAAAVARFALIGVGVEQQAVLIVAQLLHGLTFGAFHAAAITAVNSWFPDSLRLRAQALYASLTFGAGGLVGGLLGGWTWGVWGGEVTFVLSSVYALVGLVLVFAGVRDAGIGTVERLSVANPVD